MDDQGLQLGWPSASTCTVRLPILDEDEGASAEEIAAARSRIEERGPATRVVEKPLGRILEIDFPGQRGLDPEALLDEAELIKLRIARGLIIKLADPILVPTFMSFGMAMTAVCDRTREQWAALGAPHGLPFIPIGKLRLDDIPFALAKFGEHVQTDIRRRYRLAIPWLQEALADYAREGWAAQRRSRGGSASAGEGARC